MAVFWEKLLSAWISTRIPQQVADVDIAALVSNPWFFMPIACWLAYMVYRQKWKGIIIAAVLILVWFVSGTEYMGALVVNGEVQIFKIIPVLVGGAVSLAIVIYLIFGGSD
ncbi:hypothetical protein [Desulfotalea psychrophila]|uniref:hypothetical protein n=1 Tax=Desulfotalea psychrophila TaxID=84980 RepID=UPI00059D47A8|nr:hypothetical protein [Desulfotalea psychrophila]